VCKTAWPMLPARQSLGTLKSSAALVQVTHPWFSKEYKVVGEGNQKVGFYNLTMPNTHGVWVGTFGRPPFAGPRRNASMGFLRYMQDGVPLTPPSKQ
jgi:hypothetical protein